MSNARTPRVPRSLRSPRNRPADASPLPSEVAAVLGDRGWSVVEHPGRVGPVGPGSVARGRRWVVTDGTGRYADLVLVPVPAEAADRALLVERIDVLRGLDHEHLAAVEEVLEAGSEHVAVLTRRPTGIDLALLLGCRGPFAAGEAVTLLVPVAQAIAVLHHAGISYGGIERSDILLGSDGRALLRSPLDLTPVPPTEDVRSLAELVVGLLEAAPGLDALDDPSSPTTDRALLALHTELSAARSADPRVRPAIGTFAALCYEAAPPVPITLPDGARLTAAAIAARSAPGDGIGELTAPWLDHRSAADDDTVVKVTPGATGRAATRAQARREGPGRRQAGPSPRSRSNLRPWSWSVTPGGPHRPLLAAALALGVCGVLAAGGLALRAHLTAGEGPSAVPDPAVTDVGVQDPTLLEGDPVRAATVLTERRIEVLAGQRTPDDVLVPGSPAAAVDAELLESLGRAGTVLDGARAVVESARPLDPAPGGAAAPGLGDETRVEVTYSVSAHTQRGADGATTQVPTGAAEVARLTLRWTEDGWRVSDVA